MSIQRKAIDQDQRTVELAFSSDEPIEDFPGFAHILEHTGSAVSLSRLNDGAPVLVNHDYSDHVGVVERAWVGDDRKGRAVVRFGTSARASEVFNDVVDGIRRHISVGANITGDVVRDDKLSTKERDVFRVMGWEPQEISFASVPADPNVGVGRSAKSTIPQEPKMPEPSEQQQSDDSQLAIERQNASKDTATRINEIYAIGEEYGVPELAREYATNGKTSDSDLNTLRRSAMDKYFERKQAEIEDLENGKQEPLTQIGLSDNEVKRYSITRALNAFLENDWQEAGFERECSKEISRILDKDPQGVFIPHEVQTRRYRQTDIQREMTTGGAGTGAEYVGTRHSPENFIEQLRNTVVATRAGARLLPGMRQNLDIPIKTSGATFAWVAEGGTTTLSDLGTDNLTLSPKTVTGGTQASRRMLKQSIPAIDDMIMQDLVEGAAEAIDLGALQGSGAANQPTGIVNTSGVPTSTIASAGDPTLAETVEFETDVASGNALRGSLAWVTTAAVRGNMKLRPLDAGSGRFLIDPVTNAGLLGYPVLVTNSVAANTIIFGNFQELLIAMWGVLDLMPDPYGAANAGALIIRAFQDIDIGVRHAASFSVNA